MSSEFEGASAVDECTQSLGGIETPGALVVARIPSVSVVPRVSVPVCVVKSVIPVCAVTSVVPVCVVSRCVSAGCHHFLASAMPPAG